MNHQFRVGIRVGYKRFLRQKTTAILTVDPVCFRQILQAEGRSGRGVRVPLPDSEETAEGHVADIAFPGDGLPVRIGGSGIPDPDVFKQNPSDVSDSIRVL